MPIEEPSWWYGGRYALPSLLLAPAGALYGAISGRRMRRAPAYRSKFPVVCAGNVTVGGTGKTPLAIALAEIVRELEHDPIFLTRGYGGSIAGPHIIDTHTATAADVGDEPLLLARAAPAVVSRDRALGAKFIDATYGEHTVIIMDDGLQNPALAKDLAISVVDVHRLFGNRRCLPAGPLRAPLRVQLPRIGAVLLNGSASAEEEKTAKHLLAKYFPGTVLRAEVAAAGDLKWLKGSNVVAFAGIANPARFFALLEREGAKIAARRTFPDHHAFGDADARELLAAAETANARLVTTEKDFVRLYGSRGALGTLRDRSLTLPITMHLADGGHDRLAELVRTAIAQRYK